MKNNKSHKSLQQVLKSINQYQQDLNWQRKADKILTDPNELMQQSGSVVFCEILGKIRYLITNIDPNISFKSFMDFIKIDSGDGLVYYGKDDVWCYTHQSLALKIILENEFNLPIDQIVDNINNEMYNHDKLFKLAQKSIVAIVSSRTRGRITPYRDAMIEYEKADTNFYKQMLLDKQVEEDTKVYVEDIGYIGTIAEVSGLQTSQKIVAGQLDKKEKEYRRFIQARVLFGKNSWSFENKIELSNQLRNESPAFTAWLFYNKD